MVIKQNLNAIVFHVITPVVDDKSLDAGEHLV
jgi:hypothetical protein